MTMKEAILDYCINEPGGVTSGEIAFHLGRRQQSIQAVLRELSWSGAIVKAGTRGRTDGRPGRGQIIWTAKGSAIEAERSEETWRNQG